MLLDKGYALLGCLLAPAVDSDFYPINLHISVLTSENNACFNFAVYQRQNLFTIQLVVCRF